jgi:F0F1-type ATP synthase membrane subunit b/b'
MATWQLLLIALLVAAIGGGVLWYIWRPKGAGSSRKKMDVAIDQAVEEDTIKVFNDEFREELRNRGRLHFEKIISENAMFLQQDLQITTSQINEYMKTEITKVLTEEFGKYQESITSAKELALQSIQKTQEAIEQQRDLLEKQMAEETAKEKDRILAKFENNMADIVNHYLLAAIGNEIDLSSQMDYIFQNLEENKEAIVADIKSGQ